MSEPWATFNSIAQQAKQYEPLSSREELIHIYQCVDRLIYNGIDYLLQCTTFTEDNLCYQLAEIQAGPIGSRKIYKGKRTLSRVDVGEDVEVGAENRRIFSIGFDLFKLAKVERDIAAPRVRKIIRSMRLSNETYEQILLTFFKLTKPYCELCDELAELRIWFDEQELSDKVDEKRSLKTIKRTFELYEKISTIEREVAAGDLHRMYGTVRVIQQVVKEIRALQGRVVKAYLRMVLKPVREQALTESEALDLFQAGCLGLSRAVSKYDHHLGVNFSTFAKNWIMRFIKGNAKESSGPLIRLPGSTWELYSSILRAIRELERSPEYDHYTNADVAARIGKPQETVERVLATVEMVRTISLDETIRRSDGVDSGLTKDESLHDYTLLEEEQDTRTVAKLSTILDRLPSEDRRLVCLQNGAVRVIQNEPQPEEVIREILRQFACKAVVQDRMARAADRVVIARSEKIEE